MLGDRSLMHPEDRGTNMIRRANFHTLRPLLCLLQARSSCLASWLGLFLCAAGCSSQATPLPLETVLVSTRATTSEGTSDNSNASASNAQQSQESAEPAGAAAGVPPYAAALGEFNRGAALLEQYEYAQAAQAFMKVLEMEPDWSAARFNLALAYVNMAGENKPEKRLGPSADMTAGALSNFESLLKDSPDNVRYLYCLGRLKAWLGESEEALDCFERAYTQNPTDNFLAFCYGQALSTMDRFDDAIKVMEPLVQRDPGFISAVHKLSTLYVRTRRIKEAKALLVQHGKLMDQELAVGSFVVDDKYGMAGKYTLALGPDGLPLPTRKAEPVRRILFAPDPQRLDIKLPGWDYAGGRISLTGIAVADIDGDQDLDLLLTSAEPEQPGLATIFVNDGKGHFVRTADIAQQVVAACFGDIDNDGDADLWLGRAGADQVLLNDGQGHFSGSDDANISGPDVLTPVPRLCDFDSDGDLDLLAFRWTSGHVPADGKEIAAASSVWLSGADGTFVDQAAELGLQLPNTPLAAVVVDDFDDDFDLDLIAFPSQGQPVCWVNYRAGQYRLANADETQLNIGGALSATSGDPNKDGHRDLLVFTAEGTRLFLNDGRFHFTEDEAFAATAGRSGGTGGQFADLDNDGDLDIVVADAHREDGTRGPALLINNWPEREYLNAAHVDAGILLSAVVTPRGASCVAADFNGDGRCDLLLAPVGETPMLLENVTPGGNWIELDLTGKRPQDPVSRSANSAIAARVELRSGTLFQQYIVGGSSGPVASQPLRIHAGLGDYTKVEWLRIVWPDAILQGEVEVAANRLLPVDEISRKPSSCPYLFVWDGSQFAFVADFGGVGGLGYYLGHGHYARPDSTEYLPLPQLVPLDGHYVLQALTPLEEITYFDEAKLLAVDHPQGTEVFPNEMMAISVSPPEFELFCFSSRMRPLRATNHLGQDVTDQVQRPDRQYAGATDRDHRFIGLAKPHHVELDFGDQLAALSSQARIVLCLQGWVEYGYSSTNYAASQAGLRYEAPTLEVWRDGQWVELLREVGYPAGINHMMTVELTGRLLPGDQRLRVSSNMELYWDEVFLALPDPAAKVQVNEASAREADLHFRGYPREYSPDGQHPNLCDYHNLDRSVGWKLMAGDYTRYGDVRPLLDQTDDCYVIMSHGEEITLRFAVDDFGPVPDGYQRSFILKADSYCKDMDLYTAYPETVEPLPFHAMSGYPYGPGEQYPDTPQTRTYRDTWNTRRIDNR